MKPKDRWQQVQSSYEQIKQFKSQLSEMKYKSKSLLTKQTYISIAIQTRKNFSAKVRELAESITKIIHNASIAQNVAGGVGITSMLAFFGGAVGLFVFPLAMIVPFTVALGGICGGVGAGAAALITGLVKTLALKNIEGEIEQLRQKMKVDDKYMDQVIEGFLEEYLLFSKMVKFYVEDCEDCVYDRNILVQGGLFRQADIAQIFKRKINGQIIQEGSHIPIPYLSNKNSTSTEARHISLTKSTNDIISKTEVTIELATAAEKIADDIDKSTKEFDQSQLSCKCLSFDKTASSIQYQYFFSIILNNHLLIQLNLSYKFNFFLPNHEAQQILQYTYSPYYKRLLFKVIVITHNE